ncbi:MAG: hypothetical protein R3Y24_17765 [Eubacteriales bacterium]|uniref:YfjL-like protein n=1 Tax=Tannockella kyphosi TaxID=2899121 RepID=UPI002011E3DA|nr:hypothetical protein [Tannockella kyphosi]
MKKITEIIAIVVAVLLILGLLFVANGFVGNPVSKYLVDRNSVRYIEAQYSDLDLVKEIGFDFKSTRYYVKLKSETIEDLHFTLYYGMNGKLGRDLYENNITNGWNVLHRLNEDYRDETDLIFEQLETNPLFKETDSFYTSAYLMSSIEIEDRLVGFEDVSGGIDGTTLELDKDYDIAQMGAIGGLIDIDLRFTDGDESFEKGAEVIRELKRIFDEAGIGFYYISFGMINAEGNLAYRVDYLPYSQIDDENLADILKTMDETNPIDYDK